MNETILWLTVTAEVFLFIGHWHGRTTRLIREWRVMYLGFIEALGKSK
jgi:hypothetical protein